MRVHHIQNVKTAINYLTDVRKVRYHTEVHVHLYIMYCTAGYFRGVKFLLIGEF